MSPRSDPGSEPGRRVTDAAASVGGSNPGSGALDPAADSAGVPWAGRSFQPNTHAADDGSAPEALDNALTAFRSGDAGQAAVVVAFSRARLLIPLLAELGDGGAERGAHGLAVDKSQELSIVTVQGPDGRKVLPVFASVQAMSRWNPLARPVPADGVRVALAAADDGTDLVILDPGSPSEFVLRRPAVWAVAQSLDWQPPFESRDVEAAFRRSIDRELAVLGVTLLAGDPDARLAGPELVVRLELIAGLSREELDATTARLARRWAADDVIATSVDSLTVKLVGGRAG
ncbi:SseB family protein [Agromyces subbeticus]|uniref:SseB family protein n=1 Tax=Agromyces subbeticus TaxID=293890 RepID=UPI0003B5E16A|nr:SseB family protein [Agromyces subbeticus]